MGTVPDVQEHSTRRLLGSLMPIWNYRCQNGHASEKLRSFDRRDDPIACHCGATLERTLSPPHVEPDGMYSYAPNVGDAGAFERRLIAMKDGKRVIKKE